MRVENAMTDSQKEGNSFEKYVIKIKNKKPTQ